jgi:hypothetical protein
VTLDGGDTDGQTLLLEYPAVSEQDRYLHPAVTIEAGAKSALDPHAPLVLRPYVASDLPGFALTVPNVTTVDPVRTFWDKVLILHSLRYVFDERGTLRGGGQRVSRHYYDVDRMLRTETGQRAAADLAMAIDCGRHERMFFRRAGQDTAVPGTLTLTPPPAMRDLLRADYQAMAVMIFGEVPGFNSVISNIASLEAQVNR